MSRTILAVEAAAERLWRHASEQAPPTRGSTAWTDLTDAQRAPYRERAHIALGPAERALAACREALRYADDAGAWSDAGKSGLAWMLTPAEYDEWERLADTAMDLADELLGDGSP